MMRNWNFFTFVENDLNQWKGSAIIDYNNNMFKIFKNLFISQAGSSVLQQII